MKMFTGTDSHKCEALLVSRQTKSSFDIQIFKSKQEIVNSEMFLKGGNNLMIEKTECIGSSLLRIINSLLYSLKAVL